LGFNDRLRRVIGRRQTLLGGQGCGVAKEGMIQQMFQVRRGDGAVLDIGNAWDVGFAAVVVSLSDIEIRRREAQDDPGLQEIAFVPVLKEVEAFLGKMAFDFEAGAGSDNPELNIEPGRGCRVLADRDGVSARLGFFRDKVLVEEFFEFPRALGVVLESDTVEFEVTLKGVDVNGSRLAHPAVHGEMREATEPGFGTVRASKGFDEDVGEVVEVNAKGAVRSLGCGAMGSGGGGVGFGGEGGGGREVFLIDLLRESGRSSRSFGVKGIAVVFDGTVGVDRERLGWLDETACRPFEGIELEPALGGDEDGAFGAESEGEVGGVAFGAGIDFDVDPATMRGVGGFSHGGEIG